MMLAEIVLEERAGIPVARVIGEVDLSNAGDLTATMQKAVQRTSAGLVLDFSETTYLDSSGLHFIFELGKRLLIGQRLVEAHGMASSIVASSRPAESSTLTGCPLRAWSAPRMMPPPFASRVML